MRIGNAIGAAFTNRRTLGPVEARLAVTSGLVLLALAALFAVFPRVLAYPVVGLVAWIAGSLLYRGYRLHRERRVLGTPTATSAARTSAPRR
jgi:cardiolipin synthase